MLFSPYALDHLTLLSRIVIPSMTCLRTASGEVTTVPMVEYYSQHTDAGLVVSEGTQVNQQDQNYTWTPDTHNARQVAGWRQVTDAVHTAGRRILV